MSGPAERRKMGTARSSLDNLDLDPVLCALGFWRFLNRSLWESSVVKNMISLCLLLWKCLENFVLVIGILQEKLVPGMEKTWDSSTWPVKQYCWGLKLVLILVAKSSGFGKLSTCDRNTLGETCSWDSSTCVVMLQIFWSKNFQYTSNYCFQFHSYPWKLLGPAGKGGRVG